MYKIKFSNILSLIILPICLLAGLSATACLVFLSSTLILENYKNFSVYSFKNILLKHHWIIIFLSWILLSCLWTPVSQSALVLSVKIISMFLITLLAIESIDLNKLMSKTNSNLDINLHNQTSKNTFNILTISLIFAIIIYFVEIYFNGYWLKIYSKFFKNIEEQNFYFLLYKLDRGCAIISLINWLIIGYLISLRKYLPAIALYIIILSVLMTSDSLASLVAYFCSLIAFLLMTITKGRIINFIKYGIAIGSFIFLVITSNINPEEFLSQIPNLPLSAKHRIYIWNYVSKLIFEHPILGYGMDASKYISNTFAEYIIYKDMSWSLLPLHPHNNLLQVLLETGIIGLGLFFIMIFRIINQISSLENSNQKSIATAILIHYFVIGMISYGIWQNWWIAAACITYIYWTIFTRIRN